MSGSFILLPLDGSPQSAAAIPYAETMARATGCSLRLFAVIECDTLSGTASTEVEVARDHLHAIRREELTRHLGTVAERLRARGFEPETVVVAGDPADEIVAAGNGAAVRMTVLATHGRGGVGRFIIGSVADKVMRLSAHPTLLVRPPERGGAPTTVELRRVMLPLDGSPLAEAALGPAVELVAATGATLLLVRVEPYTAAMWMPEYALASGTGLDEEVAAASEAYLREVKDRLPSSLHADTVFLRGAPAAELIDVAAREGVDLVVMATHGRGGLRRLVLGSTADRMARSGVPVLLIRPSSTEGRPDASDSSSVATPAHA